MSECPKCHRLGCLACGEAFVAAEYVPAHPTYDGRVAGPTGWQPARWILTRYERAS